MAYIIIKGLNSSTKLLLHCRAISVTIDCRFYSIISPEPNWTVNINASDFPDSMVACYSNYVGKMVKESIQLLMTMTRIIYADGCRGIVKLTHLGSADPNMYKYYVPGGI